MPPPKRFEVRQIIPEHESVVLFILSRFPRQLLHATGRFSQQT